MPNQLCYATKASSSWEAKRVNVATPSDNRAWSPGRRW
jgi:hypothetical protein